MRSSSCLACFLVVGLAACGGGGGGPSGDDDPTPDADVVTPPARGFTVTSKEVVIQPGQEITYCYYFRTPNTEPLAIHKWSSTMTPGSHHMIMFTTTNDVMPPGTVSAANCGFASGGVQNLPSWTYAAQTAENEVALPSDDGTGKPLAQLIQPNTAAFFQMHYLNATDNPLTVSVTLNAEALAADTAYTQTAAYVTYDNDIDVPANATNHVESQTCDTPPNTKFWMMSTHAHRRAVKTVVKNGMPASTNIAFESDDWEHPGAKTWMQAPFYTFDGNKLTFECTYNNAGGPRALDGDSAATDEMCMASGYYFPATKPRLCVCINDSTCYLAP